MDTNSYNTTATPVAVQVKPTSLEGGSVLPPTPSSLPQTLSLARLQPPHQLNQTSPTHPSILGATLGDSLNDTEFPAAVDSDGDASPDLSNDSGFDGFLMEVDGTAPRSPTPSVQSTYNSLASRHLVDQTGSVRSPESQQTQQANPSSASIHPAPFSSVPIARPFRARYDTPQSPPDSPASATSFRTAPLSLAPDPDSPERRSPAQPISAASAKRPFSLVSPSTGSTPPALEFGLAIGASAGGPSGLARERSPSPFSGSATADAPAGQDTIGWRHSYEAQRATYSPSATRARLLVPESTLRRRSPLPSRAASHERADGGAANHNAELAAVASGGDHLSRNRSKRRRSSTLLSDEAVQATPSEVGLVPAQPSTTDNLTPGFAPAQGPHVPHSGQQAETSRSRASLPLLPRLSTATAAASTSRAVATEPIPISPSSPSSPRSRRASFSPFAPFRRSSTSSASATLFQLAPAVQVGGPSTGTSSSVALPSATGGSSPSTATLRPRSARAQPEPMREREFDPFVSFWREERRQNQARDEVRASAPAAPTGEIRLPGLAGAQLSPQSAIGTFDEAIADHERTLARADASFNQARSLLARLDGEALLASSPSTAEPVSRWAPESVGSTRSPPLSPRTGDGTPPSPRARVANFITSLRSRRPRLARGSTVPDASEDLLVEPPTDSSGPSSPYLGRLPSPALDWAESGGRLAGGSGLERAPDRSPFLPSPPSLDDMIASGPAWTSANSELDQLPALAGFNERMVGGRTDSLWGSVSAPTSNATGPSMLSRRMRGPTERANEAWREGRARPVIGAAQTTPALPPWHTTRAAPTTGISTPITIGRRAAAPGAPRGESGTVTSPDGPPRAISPSPRSRRARSDMLTDLSMEDDDEMDGILAGLEEGAIGAIPLERQRATFPANGLMREPRGPLFAPIAPAPPRTDGEEHAGPSRSLRISRLRRAPVSVERPANPLFEDEADGQDVGVGPRGEPERWRAPVLPLMLPSGSRGHRMIFPDPANAAGRAGAPLSPPEVGSHGRPRLPVFGFEATRYAHPPGSVRHQPPAAERAPTQAEPRTFRRGTLAEALAGFSGRPAAEDGQGPLGALRRRRAGSNGPGGVSNQREATPPAAEALSPRSEALATLRLHRAEVRDLLGPEGEEGERAMHSREPVAGFARLGRARSPGASGGGVAGAGPDGGLMHRRRGLGDILRGMGAASRFTQALFDDDFGAFFGRDSAALNVDNYVDDDAFDESYEALIRLSERLGDAKPKGVPEDKLAALRVVKYAAWPASSRQTGGVGAGQGEGEGALMAEGEKDVRCAVCLADYEGEDDVMLLECEHGLHEECTREWLRSHGSCPICRREHA